MYVVNELEIFGNYDELKFLYNNFNFELIKKHPSYLTDYYDINKWRYKNWGTDNEIKILHKHLVWDRLEQKLSILFETKYPSLKIINFFAIKNQHLELKLYYYDYYDYINAEFKWTNGIAENIFLYRL